MDEDVHGRLVHGLRSRGWDVQTTVGAALRGASDEEQLAFASSQRKVLVTHNVRHFPKLAATWHERGRHHWGIIILVGWLEVGTWLHRMEILLERFTPEDWRNRFVFLRAEYDPRG